MSGLSMRALLFVALALGLAVVPSAPARAEKQDARKHYERATAAFGLGRYAEAATEYEAAFGLRPEPALLYNCAQSYRLAGNKPRALELYRNYLRLFGDASNADDARKHVADLELEVAAERAVSPRAPSSFTPQASPPNPPPVSAPPAGATSAPRPAPAPTSAVSPVTAAPGASGSTAPGSSTSPPGLAAAAPAEVYVDVSGPTPGGNTGDHSETPLLRRPLFWVGVGAVLVGGTVGLLLATRGAKDPMPTFGTVAGN